MPKAGADNVLIEVENMRIRFVDMDIHRRDLESAVQL